MPEEDPWTILKRLHAEEMSARPNCHRFYNLAHKDWHDAELFHGYWRKAAGDLASLNNMIECVALKLKTRGDPNINTWLNEREQLFREKAKDWVGLCYVTNEESVPSLPKLQLVNSR